MQVSKKECGYELTWFWPSCDHLLCKTRFPFKFDTKRTGLANPDWVILIRPLIGHVHFNTYYMQQKMLVHKIEDDWI